MPIQNRHKILGCARFVRFGAIAGAIGEREPRRVDDVRVAVDPAKHHVGLAHGGV